MQVLNRIDSLVRKLYLEKDRWISLAIAIDLASEIMKGILPDHSNWHNTLTYNAQITGELPRTLPQNIYENLKQHTWFHEHPNAGSAKVALVHFEEDNCDLTSNFFWFNDSAHKTKISTAVHYTHNWEDSELMQESNNKVGIDFFLTKDTKKLLMVVSNNQNLRVLELSEKLSNTQKQIFENNLFKIFDDITENENQLIIHSRLWDALQLSEVNKKFYQGIVSFFKILTDSLKEKNNKSGLEAKQFSSRLLGRLLFVWFLRKANLINDDYGYFNATSDSSDYYSRKLKVLFFETLNTTIDKRRHSDKSTPYLNGGLFEEKKEDYPFEVLTFPDDFFVELFDHFNSFNFTTDESSPDYEIIAVDPEMLGQIFESLLANEIDESGDNERSKTGAFYTPKVIVSYMCKEALRQYLYRQIDNSTFNSGIDKLLDISDSEYMKEKSTSAFEPWGINTKTVLPKITSALEHIKIIDPAVGSGAYPLGMMQVLASVYERILPVNKYDAYRIKLSIIENNLYGVDINPMAIEIARLRTWLSLIIEDLNTEFIEPLPNLDFKFVSADSLIELDKVQSLNYDQNLDDKLDKIRKKYFNARKIESKERYKSEYYNITQQEGMSDDLRTSQLRSFDPFNNGSVAEFYDSKYMFGISDGFDIVIANPPYRNFQSMEEEKRELFKTLGYKTYRARGDIYTLFYEHGINLLKKGGILTFITSNKWMRAGYGNPLRNYFVEFTNPIQLIDLGEDIFDSAEVDTNILIVEKEDNTDSLRAVTINNQENFVEEVNNNSITQIYKKNDPWTILSPIEQSIKNKIESVGVPLKDWDVSINRGLITGLNEAFIISKEKRDELISEDSKSAEIIRPILRGRDIDRYSYNFQDVYIILAYYGIYKTMKSKYPAIYKHLKKFEQKLKKRGQVKPTSSNNSTADYPGQHHWLELDNNPSLEKLDDFNKPLIAWQRITNKNKFCETTPGMVTLDSMAYMKITDKQKKWILAVLNSTLIYYWLRWNVHQYGSTGFRLSNQYVEKIPIPIIDESKLLSINNFINNRNYKKLDLLVFEIFGLSDEEILFICQ
ncbi:MAG: N-6 DNA methylase [Clostridiaceae bacterium]|nr:N-6 DNA methylase [Clostridiaceae bacterium]